MGFTPLCKGAPPLAPCAGRSSWGAAAAAAGSAASTLIAAAPGGTSPCATALAATAAAEWSTAPPSRPSCSARASSASARGRSAGELQEGRRRRVRQVEGGAAPLTGLVREAVRPLLGLQHVLDELLRRQAPQRLEDGVVVVRVRRLRRRSGRRPSAAAAAAACRLRSGHPTAPAAPAVWRSHVSWVICPSHGFNLCWS